MMSISHWGMFSAEHLPKWALIQLMTMHRISNHFEALGDRILYGVPDYAGTSPLS